MANLRESRSQFSVSIPDSDLALFRSMSRRMGWETKKITMTSKKKDDFYPNACTIRAIEDAEAGRTHKAASADDLIHQILG